MVHLDFIRVVRKILVTLKFNSSVTLKDTMYFEKGSESA
jgi:hypothetical protein